MRIRGHSEETSERETYAFAIVSRWRGGFSQKGRKRTVIGDRISDGRSAREKCGQMEKSSRG